MVNNGEIVVYQSKDGGIELAVKLENNDIWLSQQQLVKLFNTTQQNVSLHLSNIFKEGELVKDSVHKETLYTATDGKSYKTAFYSLDAVISVGYRVKSIEGTRFRIWANKVIREHITKGYTLNEHRLKQLEEKQNAKDVNDRLLRDILNKFLGKMARKDVLDAVIDELEITKNDINIIKKLLNIDNK
jgi:hypothetical protein